LVIARIEEDSSNVIASPERTKQSHKKRLRLPRSFQSLAIRLCHN